MEKYMFNLRNAITLFLLADVSLIFFACGKVPDSKPVSPTQDIQSIKDSLGSDLPAPQKFLNDMCGWLKSAGSVKADGSVTKSLDFQNSNIGDSEIKRVVKIDGNCVSNRLLLTVGGKKVKITNSNSSGNNYRSVKAEQQLQFVFTAGSASLTLTSKSDIYDRFRVGNELKQDQKIVSQALALDGLNLTTNGTNEMGFTATATGDLVRTNHYYKGGGDWDDSIYTGRLSAKMKFVFEGNNTRLPAYLLIENKRKNDSADELKNNYELEHMLFNFRYPSLGFNF